MADNILVGSQHGRPTPPQTNQQDKYIYMLLLGSVLGGHSPPPPPPKQNPRTKYIYIWFEGLFPKIRGAPPLSAPLVVELEKD